MGVEDEKQTTGGEGWKPGRWEDVQLRSCVDPCADHVVGSKGLQREIQMEKETLGILSLWVF